VRRSRRPCSRTRRPAPGSAIRATPVTFILPYTLTGLGMGCLFAPLTTEALRRVRPEFTGVLAGLPNTSRQLGSSIGSAVAGGVMATLLASNMRARAVTAASGLPVPARSPFLGGFAGLGQTGLAVGRGQPRPRPPRNPARSTRIRKAARHDLPTGEAVRMQSSGEALWRALAVYLNGCLAWSSAHSGRFPTGK
jgi:hypothetical protein